MTVESDCVPTDKLKIKTRARMKIFDDKGKLLDVVDLGHNTVVKVGRMLLNDRLGGVTGDDYKAISYGAVGTGSGATTDNMTQLQNEIARKMSTYSRYDDVGTFSVYFSSAEANATIWEFGFFGGNATNAANSGKLFNRVRLSNAFVKDSTKAVTFEVDIVYE